MKNLTDDVDVINVTESLQSSRNVFRRNVSSGQGGDEHCAATPHRQRWRLRSVVVLSAARGHLTVAGGHAVVRLLLLMLVGIVAARTARAGSRSGYRPASSISSVTASVISRGHRSEGDYWTAPSDAHIPATENDHFRVLRVAHLHARLLFVSPRF